MADNKCAGCGQFAGRGHKCPTLITTNIPIPQGFIHPSEAEQADPATVRERVARARELVAAHRAEVAALKEREQRLREAGYLIEHESTTWETVATKTVFSRETLADGTVHTVFANGTEEWRDQNGELHNDNGPAMIAKVGANGMITKYYRHGQLHREDGPAEAYVVNGEKGMETWFQNGVLHRVGGPAVIDGEDEEWWQNGKKHREDGPAVDYRNGYTEYWVNGERQPEPAANPVEQLPFNPYDSEAENAGVMHLLRIFRER